MSGKQAAGEPVARAEPSTSRAAAVAHGLAGVWRRLVPTDPVERWAGCVAVAASVFYALAAAWDAFAPLAAGHHAAMAASAIAGENMVQRHVFEVAQNYYAYDGPPHDADLFCHHPYGTAVLEALAYKLVGHHWVTNRLPAIVCSALSAPLVYALGRAMWGASPGAVAVVAFVLVPIDLGWADYFALEVPTIFFGLLLCWGTVRLWQTGRTSYLLLAGLGAFGACQMDWVGVVLTAALAGLGFVRAYVLPRRWVTIVDERQHARWFAFLVAAGVGTVVMYLVVYKRVGHLAEFFSTYDLRAGNNTAEVGDIFNHKRRLWLSWTLTPIGIGLIGLSIPLAVGRVVWGRKSADLITLAWTCTATMQYLVFRQGADYHIFWPQYFGVSIALGAATLATELLRIAAWISARPVDGVAQEAHAAAKRALWTRRLAYGAVAVTVGVPLALLGRVALPLLRLSRQSGGVILDRGRNDPHSRPVGTGADAAQFAQWAATLLPRDAPFVFGAFPDSRNIEYGAGRPMVRAERLQDRRKPGDHDRFAVTDSRRIGLDDLRAIAHATSVQVVGPFWRIDRAGPGQHLVALRYEERQPRFFERYFVSGVDLVRTISDEEDPWATWEWRTHFGIPAEPPSQSPVTVDEKRAAYNAAVLKGQDAGPRDALLAGTIPVPEGRVPGAKLLGVAVDDGATTVATLVWEATENGGGTPPAFVIRCRIVKPPVLWPSAVDVFDYDIPTDFPFPRPLWRQGFIYVQRVVIARRFGTDACVGVSGSSPEFPLFTLGG